MSGKLKPGRLRSRRHRARNRWTLRALRRGAPLCAIQQMLLAAGFSGSQVTINVAGAGAVPIPLGANNADIELFGSPGAGGNGGTGTGGGGSGGTGAYGRSVLSVLGSGGLTIAYSLAAAGAVGGGTPANSTVSSGTFALATITAPGGGQGTNGVVNTNGTAGAAGAAATGGTTSNVGGTIGNAGNPGGGAAVAGRVGANAVNGNNSGAGGTSSSGIGSPGAGPGKLVITFT